MGLVYANIELVNFEQVMLAKRSYMDRDEVKRMHVSMLVYSGAVYLCVNEHIRDLLQLPFLTRKRARLANGQTAEYDMVGPVEVRFRDRVCQVSALVLPGDSEPLLGVIPMEDMDVLIHPQRQELVVHDDGEMPGTTLKGIRTSSRKTAPILP